MLNTLTITQAHEKLKRKEFSAEELVRACLDTIEKKNLSLNAVTFNNGESALKKAKEIDRRGNFDHPLTGIPYLAKDVYCEKGVPTTACSHILIGKKGGKTYRVSREDPPAAQRQRLLQIFACLRSAQIQEDRFDCLQATAAAWGCA